MEPSNSSGGIEASASQTISPDYLKLFEPFSRVLLEWEPIRLAIENQVGGPDFRQIVDSLVSSILSSFSRFPPPKDPYYYHYLAILLKICMSADFHTSVDTGSAEKVAKELMDMHEDCLKGNYESIDKLRKSVPATNDVRHSKRVINDDDDDESLDEEGDDDAGGASNA